MSDGVGEGGIEGGYVGAPPGEAEPIEAFERQEIAKIAQDAQAMEQARQILKNAGANPEYAPEYEFRRRTSIAGGIDPDDAAQRALYADPDFRRGVRNAPAESKKAEEAEEKKAEYEGEPQDIYEVADQKQAFNKMVKSGDIPEGAVFVASKDPSAIHYYTKEQWAEIQQQEAGSRTQLLAQGKLSNYYSAGGYNLAQALADGVSEKEIRAAGFTQKQIDDQAEYVKYLKASPQEKFEIMKSRKDSKIPSGAKFDHVDAEGNIYYKEDILAQPELSDEQLRASFKKETPDKQLTIAVDATGRKVAFENLTKSEQQAVLERYARIKGLEAIPGNIAQYAKEMWSQKVKDYAETEKIFKKETPDRQNTTIIDATGRKITFDKLTEAEQKTVLERYAKQIGRQQLVAEYTVPGVYTKTHWNEMSVGERAIQIIFDAAFILPYIPAAARGARAVSTPGRIKRFTGALKGVGEEVLAQATGPVTMILNPTGGIKAGARGLQDNLENAFNMGKIPQSVITTADSVVMWKVTGKTTEAEGMMIRNKLMALVAEGKKPVIEFGGIRYELARSPLMKEIGGGLVHATPDISVFEQGAKVKTKPGLPTKEQGWFLSNEPATRFTERSAFGGSNIPLPTTATGEVADIAKFRPSDLVRVDKYPIRELNLADIKSVPEKLAKPLENYIRNNNGRVAGSFVEWLKLENAAVPNDLDLVFLNRHKAIDDLYKIAKVNGFITRKVTKGIEILKDGKWIRVAEVRSAGGYERMIPKGLTQPPNKVKGINVTTLGEQYLRQSYGAVAGDIKAATRAEKLAKAASDVKDLLKAAGAKEMKPGIFIISSKTAGKTVPSEKLFYDFAELEKKLVVGADIPKPKQKLFTRLYPTGQRVEIWLEEPLSIAQRLKLKGLAVIEDLKAPFKPAMLIKEIGEAEDLATIGRGLNSGEVDNLARELERAGNREVAENLRRASRTTATQLGRAITEFRERISDRGRIVVEGRIPERERLANRTNRIASRVEAVRVEVPRGYARDSTRESTTREIPRRTPAERARAEAERERVKTPIERISRERIPPERVSRERITPERFTERITRERILPERVPPERVPPERPPRILPSYGEQKNEWTKEEAASAVAWRQGIGWWAVRKPYDKEDWKFFLPNDLPEGIQRSPDQRTAFDTIQAYRGNKSPENVRFDMGIMDVFLRHPTKQPGSQGAIRFRRDPSVRASNNGLISIRRGRIYHTKVRGGTLLSRQPISGARVKRR